LSYSFLVTYFFWRDAAHQTQLDQVEREGKKVVEEWTFTLDFFETVVESAHLFFNLSLLLLFLTNFSLDVLPIALY